MTTPINEVVLADALRMAGCTEEEIRVMLAVRSVAGDAVRAAKAGRVLATRDRDVAALAVLGDLDVLTNFVEVFLS